MLFYFSVLGGIFLVGGLYSVLWGKSKEQNEGKLTVEEGENKERGNTDFVSEDEKRKAEVL